MQEIKLMAKGTVPLLIHCNQTANPLNAYSKYLKPLTGKRKKTDQDVLEISRVEWEAGLYLNGGVVVMPSDNIDRCLWNASKSTKNGVQYKKGVLLAEDYSELNYKGPKIKVKQNGEIPNSELDKYFEQFKHMALVKVNSSTTLRTRPIFHDWSFTFTLIFDETVIDRRTLLDISETAGKYIGLCEKRPRLGKFEIQIV